MLKIEIIKNGQMMTHFVSEFFAYLANSAFQIKITSEKLWVGGKVEWSLLFETVSEMNGSLPCN